MVLLFLFTPYLVRALPREMYGSYSQALFLTEFTGILFTMAILQTAMVFFNDKKYSFPDSLKTIVVFTLGAGVLALLALEVFSIPAPHIFRNELLGPYLRIYAFSLLGSKLNLVLNQALIHQGKSRQLMILSVSSNLLKLCLALLAIQKFHSMPFLLMVYAAEPLISSAIQWYLLKKEKQCNGRFDNVLLKQIFRIGLPLYLVEILGASYTYIAGFIISLNLNEVQYALYRNGSVELPVIGTLYTSISLVFMADFSKYIQEGKPEWVAAIKKKMITTTAVLIFPVAIFFVWFSREFILLYLSSKYEGSAPVFAFFSLVLLVRVQNYTDVLVLLRKPQYVLMSFAVFLISNVSLNLILSHYYGIYGCAVATILSVFILAFMQLHLTIRELHVSYSQYIDVRALSIILLSSVLYIGVFKLLFYYIPVSHLVAFLTAGILTVPVLIFVFIRKKLVDISHYQSIFEKIPWMGMKLYRLLQ